jgi:ribosomal protein S18 acetylase RimI-like enzyme
VVDLRPAGEHDRELLWLIQSQSMRPSVEAAWGWDESFQRAYFEEHYGERSRQIVRVDGSDAGVLSFDIRPDHVFLSNVALLPQFQGRGIGTVVIGQVMDEAARLGLPVRLQVLKANRARRLYERLGFRVHAETATHFQMVFEREAGHAV